MRLKQKLVTIPLVDPKGISMRISTLERNKMKSLWWEDLV